MRPVRGGIRITIRTSRTTTACCAALAVDRVAGLGVEEVQPVRVDGELDPLALRRRRVAVEPRDPRAALDLGSVLADGGLDVLAEHHLRAGAEVDEHLRAHVLADVDDRAQRLAVAEARVLDVLGPHAEDQPPALESREPRP